VAHPIVAIVGRPNVGKSALFNRIVGRRQAIVDQTAGLTRDRLYGIGEWRGHEFTVVDTAGIELAPRTSTQAAVEAQTRIAIAEADVIVFLLDVREGVGGFDRDVAQLLRRSRVPVLVAGNKADNPGNEHYRHELLELGFGDAVLVSAQHGIGVDELLDRVLDALPAPEPSEEAEDESARLALMGRPNVGKSSLLNALLGDERAVVSETPGTTRDPVDTTLLFDGLPVVLVDTAGIRRRSAARDRLERFSLLRGIYAMERADAVLLVLDASEGILAQDLHVADYALEAGKGLVLVLNKVDLLEDGRRETEMLRRDVHAAFRFVPHAPLVAVSAKTGQGVKAILPVALEVVGQRRVRIPTNQLNRVLREAFLEKPPPSYKGRRLSLDFATQASSEAPTIVLFVNDTGLLHFSYRRYLENRLRREFGFAGNPVRIVLRQDREKKEKKRA
jgi:GTP-binding protein